MQKRAVDKRDFVHKRRILGVKKGKKRVHKRIFSKNGYFLGKIVWKTFQNPRKKVALKRLPNGRKFVILKKKTAPRSLKK
jgi:hypothetical protein